MQVKHKYRTKKLMHKTKSQDENVLINYVITFAVSLFKLALCPSMRRCTEVVPGTIQNAPTATPTALVVVHIVCALCCCRLLGYLAILGVFVLIYNKPILIFLLLTCFEAANTCLQSQMMSDTISEKVWLNKEQRNSAFEVQSIYFYENYIKG